MNHKYFKLAELLVYVNYEVKIWISAGYNGCKTFPCYLCKRVHVASKLIFVVHLRFSLNYYEW